MFKRVLFAILIIALNSASLRAMDEYCSFRNIGLDAEFLWWKANDDNLRNTLVINNTASDPSLASTTNLYYSYGWDPGVRLGFIYEGVGCCTGYNLFGTWTWFRGSDNSTLTQLVGADETVSISMMNNSTLTSDTADSLLTYRIDTDFLYNRFDLGVSSELCCGCNFMIEGNIAFTYAYIHQTLNEFGNITVLDITSTDAMKVMYPGYGITIGGELAYTLTNCLFVYSKGSLTGLWGNYSVRGIVDDATISTISNVDSNFWRGRFICGLQIGFEYNTCLCNRFPLSAQLGWEFQYLPGIDVTRTIFSSRVSTITINGLVAGLELEF